MTKSNQKQTVLLVSLTGDEQIKLYDLDAKSGALHLRAVSNAGAPLPPIARAFLAAAMPDQV